MPTVVDVVLHDAKTGQSETLTCTPEHPLYVQGQGWVEAGSLGIGTSIVSRAGPALEVTGLTWQKNKAQELAAGTGSSFGGYTVYNLTVEGDHTFFVGSTGGGTWVHNALPCDIGKLRSAGEFSPTASSRAEAEAVAQKAFPNFEVVPEATAGAPYPKAATNQWYQVHPAEPIVLNDEGKSLPHIKYEDWTGGKKGRGGNWGHIFFNP